MNTLLLSSDSASDIKLCADFLHSGQLVAVPTETVYGLAADASNPDAVKVIFAAKGRPANHPLIVHVPGKAAISQWAKNVSNRAFALADAFWPGPLTLLLHKADHVSSVVTGGLNTIGLRMPSHPVLLSLLQQSNLAVAAPSANLYKKLSPTSASQVMAAMQGRIPAVLDGGACQYGLESTIVDLTGEKPIIVRAGPVSAADIATVLGESVAQPKQHSVAVPGNVDAHYQPGKTLYCYATAQLQQELATLQQPVAVLHYSDIIASPLVTSFVMPVEAADYGRQLYQTLFNADQAAVTAIWCEMPPDHDNWRAIHDRLLRAKSN
ncbi:L-threonylcarbamoyladenylate synthase [Arsukibacterium indicum]|uniref:Threonylcarbamoyl-AMP synthase n=1 Tax=Arsukibacterium indicum TaxID=2848612 RepID=A0ABS6MNN6_9GAMM|nr:L-threonylcarbamoyladenylate synthase [Arsukibacterium indicum]MBV2130416.1 threonylcarbamoyl-AMP synthase [Arsukibacterium indicum]